MLLLAARIAGYVLGKWNYYSKTIFNVISIAIAIILYLLYMLGLG